MFFCNHCGIHFYSLGEKKTHTSWMHPEKENSTDEMNVVTTNADVDMLEEVRSNSDDMFSPSRSPSPSDSFKLQISQPYSESSQSIPLGQKVKEDLGLKDDHSDSDSDEKESILIEETSNDNKDEEDSLAETETERQKNKKKEAAFSTAGASQKPPLEALLERVKSKKEEKEALKEEIQRTDEAMASAKKGKEMRNIRLEVLSNTINRQEVELFRQKESGKKDIGKRAEVIDTKEINEGMNKIRKCMEELSEGIERFGGKNEKLDSIRMKKLKELNTKWKKIVIMCPGYLEEQQKCFRDDIARVDNLEIIFCVDEGMKKMVGALKNMGTEGGKENKMGVCLLKYGREGDDDKERMTNEIKKIMGQLMVVTARGNEKFGKVVIVIPAVTGKNWEFLRMLEEEVKEKIKDCHIINLMEEQMNMGKKELEEKGSEAEVWRRENLVFANRYGKENEEANGLVMNQYVFRRCLVSLAKITDPQDGQITGCLGCGFEHPLEEPCLLNEKKEVI